MADESKESVDPFDEIEAEADADSSVDPEEVQPYEAELEQFVPRGPRQPDAGVRRRPRGVEPGSSTRSRRARIPGLVGFEVEL